MTTTDDAQDDTGAQDSSDPSVGSDESPDSDTPGSGGPGSDTNGSDGTDQGDADSGDPGSTGDDSGGNDSGSSDSSGTDSGGEDSGSTDSGSADSGGDGSGSDDSGSADSGGDGSGGDGSDGTDSGGTDPGGDGSGSDGSGSNDSGSNDSGSNDSGGDDSGGDDSGSTASDGTDSDGTDSGGDGSGGDGSGGDGSGSTDSGNDDSDPAASETDDGATGTGGDAGTALPTDEAGAGAGSGSSSTPVDLGPPYLIVDQYSGDSGMNPPWATLVGLPQYYGAILKAWEGPAFNDGGWFAHNWPAVRQAGADRYGSSWFRGAYLFLKFNASGAAQADAYLKAVDDAGGWDSGDILPVVDVELGGKTNSNRMASKQQVIDCVSACTARLKEKTGRRVMLYGRGAMRDLHIIEKMGADVAWNPSYTPTMHKAGLEGFAVDEIVLWQYCGDNEAYLPNYPHQVKGFAKLDISVFIKGSAEPTLDDVRSGLLT